MQTQMKHILILATLMLASCAGSIDIFGHKVEVVQNRNPDGTFRLPLNAAGETADANATVYHFPSGSYGVSLWNGGGLSGTSPKLSQ